MDGYNGKSQSKMDDLGYPYFRNPPNFLTWGWVESQRILPKWGGLRYEQHDRRVTMMMFSILRLHYSVVIRRIFNNVQSQLHVDKIS